MQKVRDLIQNGEVDPDVVQATLQELMGYVWARSRRTA